MLVLLFLIMSFFFVGCNDKPVDTNNQRTPREYQWTIDTVAYPGSVQTIMQSIWGSSPNDVYIVGHNDRGFGQMFHFNGSSWTPVSLNFGAIDLGDVFGFAPNDVWAVGERIFRNVVDDPYFIDSSLIIHYDGVKWSDYKVGRGRRLRSLWGTNKDNVWFGGNNGTLFHYNGINIKEDLIFNFTYHSGESKYNYYSFTGNLDNKTYVLMNIERQNEPTRYSIFERKNQTWDIFDDSSYLVKSSIWLNSSGSLVATGYETKIKEGSIWKTFPQEDSIITTSVNGNADNNIFLVGYSNNSALKSEILHYDGNNWHRYNNLLLSNVIPHDLIVFQNEVFVVCETYTFPAKTIILHGK